MNELNQVTHLYISQGDIKRIYNGCDLGDSVKVNVYQYPHKDQLAYLDCFVLERKDLFQDAVKLLKSRDKEINELRLIISGKTFDAEYAKAQSEVMGLMQEKIEKASARIEELLKALQSEEPEDRYSFTQYCQSMDYGYTKQLEEKDSEIARLRNALRISGEKHEGMAMCFEAHGSNLNLPFLIDDCRKDAQRAREALAKGDGDE